MPSCAWARSHICTRVHVHVRAQAYVCFQQVVVRAAHFRLPVYCGLSDACVLGLGFGCSEVILLRCFDFLQSYLVSLSQYACVSLIRRLTDWYSVSN